MDWVWAFPILCEQGGVLDVCLCFGCGDVGGVDEEWVWGVGLGSGGVGWCYVCVSCESGFLCVDGRVQVTVYCAWRIPAV